MKKNLWGRMLSLFGWKVLPVIDEPAKSIICVAPHTSNWDFPIGLCYYKSIGRDPHFVMKKEWFFWPMGALFRRWGGIPVDRSKGRSLVDEVIRVFGEQESFHVAVTPEGTRSYTTKWKTGFYRMAVGADVPIELARIDYKRKEVGIFEVFYPTGDMQADIEAIRTRFHSSMAKFPEKFQDLNPEE